MLHRVFSSFFDLKRLIPKEEEPNILQHEEVPAELRNSLKHNDDDDLDIFYESENSTQTGEFHGNLDRDYGGLGGL